MEQRWTRRQAAEELPTTSVAPKQQLGGGVFLLVLGAALTVFPLVFLRVLPVIGIVLGFGLYLLIRGPIGRSGIFSGGIIAIDPDGIVRVLAGMSAITRASRQFTNQRHLGREIWLGLAFVAGSVVVCIVMVLAGVGLVCVGMLGAILGLPLAEAGLVTIRAARRRRANPSTMLDGIPMVVLLAAYLYLGGRTDELGVGLPADVLLNRLDAADDQTLQTAGTFIAAWQRLQGSMTYGGS